MTKTKNYAQILPKISVERTGLLNNKTRNLCLSNNLSDFVAQLSDTTYGNQVTKINPPITPKKLERAFNENLINTYFMLLTNLPKNMKSCFELYLKRFEVEHIKTLLKTTIAQKSPNEKLSKIYLPIENYFNKQTIIKEAINASTILSIVQAYKKTEYYTQLNTALQNYNKTGSTIHFSILLDKQHIEHIYNTYQKMPKNEQPHAKFYISMNVDGFTLFTILRGKAIGYDDPVWIKNALPTNNFNITKQTIDNIINASDYYTAIKIIETTPYKTYFTQTGTPEETIVAAQKTFKRAIIQHAKSHVLLDVFNIGAPLSFITLKETDIHNLNVIALSIEASLKPEEIQKKLLTYY